MNTLLIETATQVCSVVLASEGRILARLHHPNLVRVFDLDFDVATQTLYFVMDLVLYKDGQPYTLADVEDGSADEDHLSRWFGQLASALDYIHNAGIVHQIGRAHV